MPKNRKQIKPKDKPSFSDVTRNDELIRKYLQFTLLGFIFLIGIAIAKYLYMHQDLYGIWSFRSNDPPWMPPGVVASPILGEHFFGDFQLPYGLAKTEHAYGNSYNPTLPLGFLFFEVLAIFPLRISFTLFLCLSLFSLGVTTRKISVGQSEISKLVSLVLVLTSLPIFIAIDRGALILLTLNLFVVSWLNLQKYEYETQKQKYWLNVILLSIVLSWKPYLLLLVILNLKNLKIRTIYNILGATFTLNLISLLVFFQPISDSIHGIFNSYRLQLGSQGLEWLYGGVSINKMILAGHYYLNGRVPDTHFLNTMSKLSLLVGTLYIFVVVFLNRFVFSQKSTRFALSLSICSFVVPVSMAYTLVWTFLAILVLINGLINEGELISSCEKNSTLILLIGTSLLTLPWPTEYYLTIIPGLWIFCLIFILIFNAYKYLEIRTLRRK